MHDHHDFGPEITIDGFNRDIAERHSTIGKGHRNLILISGALLLVGIAAFAARAIGDGFEYRSAWGYYAAVVAFLMTTAGAAPLVIVALRLVKAHWRRPLARVSELYAAVGLLTFVMFLPLLFLVPSANNRFTLWFQADEGGSVIRIPGAPHFWIVLLLALLTVCGLALLYISSRPDRASLSDMGSKPRGMMSRGWLGTRKQWLTMSGGLAFLGAFYFILLVGTLSLFSVDFAMALVPGWKDAIFPAFQSLTGLQAGLATVIVTAWLLRRYGGFQDYIRMEHFWGASKILLALSLMWFYFWWSGFIIFWYGRLPVELDTLNLLMFGPYRVLFFGAFILNFVAPFLILLWNVVRKTTWGPTLAAASILIGTLIDKVRIYVASYSVDFKGTPVHIADHDLALIPGTQYPDALDLLIVAGGIAGGIFVFSLAARYLPVFSLWEMSEGLRLRAIRPFLRTRILILGKPE